MQYLFSKPSPVLEERGPGWFAPARPRPHDNRPSALNAVRYARYSLISLWPAEAYQSCCVTVRAFRRQVILANSPASLKYFLATAHEKYERKSPQLRQALGPLLGDGLFVTDGENWKRQRPLVVDIVHKSRLPNFAKSMEAVAAETVARWDARKADEVFDVMSEMSEMTAEIIARAVFGNNLGSDAVNDVVVGFNAYLRHVDSVNLPYFLGFDDGFPIARRPKLKRAIERVHKVVDQVFADHLAGHGDASSMVEMLLRRQQKTPELNLDISALRNEAASIFMAGQETTATTLCWAWYLLSNAPWVEEALLAEIERVCGNRAPRVDDVANLPWCRSVIEETLRLYPPVPVLARQARQADEFEGIKIEPASLVIVTPWLLHRAENLWDRATHFRPERFLTDRPTPYTYAPFAIGPRICPGLNFGLSEAILCLATLFQRFRVRIAPDFKVEPVCRLSLRPLGGLPVTVERR